MNKPKTVKKSMKVSDFAGIIGTMIALAVLSLESTPNI